MTFTSYSYNAFNQKLSETVTYPVILSQIEGFSKSFSYDYTANGLKKHFTMPDGTAYEYTYGDNNELREIRLPGTGAISYPSYTWTRPDAIQYPGGGRREYDYDLLMRITRILAKDPGKNIVLDSSYSYDTMDNILSKQTGQGTYNYTYDALYRLTDVQVDIPGQENEGFSYDAVGNRLSEDGAEGEWTYNANNELLSFATTEYTYDANGNATQLLLDGSVMFTYHYNAQDRLVQVEDVNGSTIAEYAYDPFGRRLWKDVGGTKTYFFYADEGLVAEYDSSGTELRSYGYRPDSTWTTDPLWLKQDGEYYFYQNDHLGTPQKLVQMNGAIAWSASYAAFGKATIEVETVVNNLRFPGQYFDAETGLHYNWQRYYDPKRGRYFKKDPIGFVSEDVNLYAYVWNCPVKWIDPFGLKWFPPLFRKRCRLGERPTGVLAVGLPDAIRAWSAKRETEKLVESLKGYTGHQPKAFRHCYVNCILTQRIGVHKAKKAADIHELCGMNPMSMMLMDLHNNEVGRMLAETGFFAYTSMDCEAECKKALCSGMLIIDPDFYSEAGQVGDPLEALIPF